MILFCDFSILYRINYYQKAGVSLNTPVLMAGMKKTLVFRRNFKVRGQILTQKYVNVTFEEKIWFGLRVCLTYEKYFICLIFLIHLNLEICLNIIMRNKMLFLILALARADFLDSVLPMTCP